MRKTGFLILAGVLLMGAAVTFTTGQMNYRAPFTGSVPQLLTTVMSQNVVSVRNFGADASGATDSTAAAASAYAAQTNGTVLYPTGTYKATNIKLKPKLTLQGQGIESTTLSLGSNVGTLITSDVTNNSYAGMRDLTVRGDNATVGQKLLQIQGLFASHFDRVFFSSAENLVELSEVEGQTEFRDCYFTFAGANGYGLRLNNVQEVIIENSPFENSAHGVYATRTNAVTRLKFSKIHSENVGQLFNIDTNTNNGSVSFRDITAFNVGANLADPTTGYAFRINNEHAMIDNARVTVTNALTPVVTTPLWSIFAKDCPSFTGADATECDIPHFEIGLGSAYIPNTKTPLLSNATDFNGLYTISGGAAVVTTAGTGAFSGLGQYRIRPLTKDPIANTAVMVRFEYKSSTATAEVMNLDNMSPQMIGYSGSTVTRAPTNSLTLPSTAGVWTKVYAYVRYTGEFSQGTNFFYFNTTNVADTMEFRNFSIFAVDRPPYSLMDWGGPAIDSLTTIATGINANGNGFKHARVTTGSIGAGVRADVVLTWTTAFLDTNYSVVCNALHQGVVGTDLRLERVRIAAAGSVTAQVINDSAGALTGTLECIAVHD